MSVLGDDVLVPQLRLGARIGAIKELTGETMFYVQVPMAAVNWSVGYYATPINGMVSLAVWYALLPVGFLAAACFHYVVVRKASIAFHNEQAADTEANAQYRRMVEDHDEFVAELAAIRSDINDLAEDLE